jgi:type I restriction enzyme, S subunit
MSRSVVGDLPAGWRATPLKHLATSSGGMTPSKDKPAFWEGEIPWVSPKDMKRAELDDSTDHVSEAALQATGLKLHPPGGVMVVVRGMILAHTFPVARNSVPVTVNQDMKVLRPVEGTDSRYLAWMLQGLEPVMLSLTDESAHGTKALRTDQWANLAVPVPDMQMQERIANFLDEQTARIDALIAEKDRLSAFLGRASVDLLHDTVTKGLSSTSMRSSGREWIGDMPSHWTAPYIRFVARLESGHTPSRQHPEYWVDCDIPWFSLADVWQIRDGRREVVTETAEMVSELGIANSSARLLPAGTVMLSRTASVGFSAVMGVPMATTQDFVNWVCGPSVLPEYLLYVFRSMGAEFERLKFGSTHATIYMPDVAKFTMPLPPLEEQQAIVAMARARKAKMDELKELATAESERLREYRSSLITTAVTGQLDVSTFKTAA